MNKHSGGKKHTIPYEETDLKIQDPDSIEIYANCGRDGVQGRVKTPTVEQLIKYAGLLEKMGVKAFEIGWTTQHPLTGNHSDNHQRIINIIQGTRKTGNKIRLSVLTRFKNSDVERLIEIKKHLHKYNHNLEVFLLGQGSELKQKLDGTTQKAVIAHIKKSVTKTKEHGFYVTYCPEHAIATHNLELLAEQCTAAIESGVDNITIPDTNGGAPPNRIAQVVAYLKQNIVKNHCSLRIHTHNDRGLGTINSLIGLENGATGVEGTFGGFGERVGNADLREVILNLVHLGASKFDMQTFHELTEYVNYIFGVNIAVNAPGAARSMDSKAGMHEKGYEKLYLWSDPDRLAIKPQLYIGFGSSPVVVKDVYKRLGLKYTEKKGEFFTNLVNRNPGNVYDEEVIVLDKAFSKNNSN